MEKTIVAIIQAHMSSSRLPGKIMMDICGEPALYRMIERVRRSRLINDIVIATSTLPCDDIIVERCADWGVHTFRGSDSDVLARYWGAAQAYPADIYVRMTSDCPMVDPAVVDDTIRFFLEHDYRYVCNSDADMEPTLPAGLACEVFEAALLKEAAENATEGYEHEHVTPYMYWKQDSAGFYPYKTNESHIRVTLDTPEDYDAICRIYKALYTPGNTFTIDDIITYMSTHPEVAAINAGVVQRRLKR